ncbi:MAG: Wzz/FepE/Etk N-terminal domain-containing protein [Acidobacteriota bacterium]
MSAQPSFPWREIAEALFRRKFIALAFALFGLALGAYTGFTATPAYEASATLLFEVQRGRLTGTGMQNDRVDRWDITQQIELLRSRSLVREVLLKEGWTDEQAPEPPPFTWKTVVYLLPQPRRLANRIYAEIHHIQGQTPLERYVSRTLNSLEVSPVRGANLIRLNFSSTDAEYAAYFVNNLLDAHIQRSMKLSPESQARDFLIQQKEEALTRLELANSALRAYKQRTGLGTGIVDETFASAQITQLEQARSSAQISMRELEARVQAIDRQLTDLPKDLTTGSVVSVNPILQTLEAELANLQVEKTRLLSKYAPGSQRMRDLDRQIELTQQSIADQATSTTQTTTTLNPAFTALSQQKFDAEVELQALRARLAGLEESLAESRSALQAALSTTPELAKLEEEQRQATAIYSSYSARAEQARYAGELDETSIFNLSVIEPAVVPWKPLEGNRTRQVLISGVLWMMLGCVAALARDFLDPTVKSASQAARCSGLPVIAEIPA